MRFLCWFLECKLVWFADIATGGLYQCSRCKTVSRGTFGWNKEVRRASFSTDEQEETMLRLGFEDLIKAAESYMHYHNEKFYEGSVSAGGLWPAIRKARAVLSLP